MEYMYIHIYLNNYTYLLDFTEKKKEQYKLFTKEIIFLIYTVAL